MRYAVISNGQAQEINTNNVEIGGVQFSRDTMLQWSDAEKAKYGIQPIIDDSIPAGKVPTNSTLTVVNGEIHRQYTLVDAPAPPDPITMWDTISLKIAFAHENRIRVLEGKAVITPAQFKTAVRNMADV